jgi:hypothetical protein
MLSKVYNSKKKNLNWIFFGFGLGLFKDGKGGFNIFLNPPQSPGVDLVKILSKNSKN